MEAVFPVLKTLLLRHSGQGGPAAVRGGGGGTTYCHTTGSGAAASGAVAATQPVTWPCQAGCNMVRDEDLPPEKRRKLCNVECNEAVMRSADD